MDKNIVKDYITTITILEHISDAIFILDAQTRIQYANLAAIQSLRISMEELKDKEISVYLRQQKESQNEKDHIDNLIESINQEVLNEVEMTLQGRSAIIPVMVSFGMVKNANKEVQFIIVSVKDISIRKQLEKEIAQKKEITLSQNRIKSMGDLAVSLVHQLSQPLATIKLQLELAERKLDAADFDKEKFKSSLQRITGVVESMSTTLNNVRHFAFKVDDDSLKLIDLNDSINNALSQISYELQENEIKVDVETEQSLPLVSGVPINIEQVFIMLIKYFRLTHEKNKEKITPSNIFIKITRTENKWVDVFISEDRELITTKLVKKDIADVIFNMKVELSTIKAIIETMGGLIKVKKNENDATCFELRIPADEKTERDQLLNLIELMHQEE